MNLKIDMDGWRWPTIHHIVRHHRYLKTVIDRLGWMVLPETIEVYRSAGGKGRHVEMAIKTTIRYHSAHLNIVMLQNIFGDDPRRALWCISRILSAGCPEFREVHNWNILWDEKNGKRRKYDAKGTERLRSVWR